MKLKRNHWLNDMIQQHGFTIGAEVGVNIGSTTSFILEKNGCLFVYAVDNWGEMENDGKTKRNDRRYNEFKRAVEPFKHKVKVLEGCSWEQAKYVPNESLDFVFIDACHQYPFVMYDILAWVPKLKPTGMLSGHDLHFEGVIKSLDELNINWTATGIDHTWFVFNKDIEL